MKNLVVIVADTVRSDHLGVHGGTVHTPNLDRLARSGADFTRARAASFPTVPARADYLTGVYALTNGGWGAADPALPRVPELLSAAGVTTAAVVDTPFYKVKGYNFDRGFRYFYDMETQSTGLLTKDPRQAATGRLVPEPRLSEFDYCAPRTLTQAEKCLDQLVERDRFFLLVDTWDPHEPWDPPAWYARRYKPDYDGRVVNPAYGDYRALGFSDDDLATAHACYCGELEMVDRWIGRLLDRIDSLGIGDETAVVFVSDHGFYFGERGVLGKMIAGPPENGERRWLRSPLHSELVDVPLMIRVPGAEPRTVDRVVSAIDLAPTLLDLMDVPVPEPMQGHSLAGLAAGSDDGAVREAAISAMPLSSPGAEVKVVDDVTRSVLEWQPITVTGEQWSMLFSRWEDPVELYDGADADPGQARQLAAEHPDVVRDLHGLMIDELRRGGAGDADIRARS